MMVILSALKYRSLKLDSIAINGIRFFAVFTALDLDGGRNFLCTAMPDFLADAPVSLELFRVAMFYPGYQLCHDELNGKFKAYFRLCTFMFPALLHVLSDYRPAV
ncbi:hypothetical protein DP590_17710 [Salmonella enterica]|nr:hypothetical protein [Salmonella enterica]ECE0740238.1 hypothetical protein [Salmonella enterica subsp. enterica serovar Hvittingfoss]HEC8062333.1 hypothetical protein [Salmonella enterica subsp. enterica serovar Potsdam]EGA8118210.1 hypothetical protein [Salmonella enterica]EHO8673489.1 hypothetical protein [Salmonella enterica]